MHRALVERARQGDESAFAALSRTHGGRCMAIAFRILRDVDLAEDAVQTSFITAWRRLPTLRDPDRFEPWLHRMLVHACYAEARKRRHHSTQLPASTFADTYAADEILTVHHRDQLERGFRRLSPEHRAVLVFHHYLGLSLPEVADRLGVPVGTAKSRLHYASAALRAVLEADARVPGGTRERLA